MIELREKIVRLAAVIAAVSSLAADVSADVPGIEKLQSLADMAGEIADDVVEAVDARL